MNNIYFGKNWTEQMLSSYWFSPTAARNPWSPSEMINFRLHFNSQWNAFITFRRIISISKANCERREWLTIHGFFWNYSMFPSHVQVHAWWTVFTFYREAEHPMLCLVNEVKFQSYLVGQSSFTEKSRYMK